MGEMGTVRCGRCGYEAECLCGIGRQWGLVGLAETVLCTRNLELVDVSLPLPESDDQRRPRCPERNCRSYSHEPWDQEMAICPVCGAPGCVIEWVGVWD